ncbi:MAG: DUF3500 domain-containing protein [Pseudomonadota bacterium]
MPPSSSKAITTSPRATTRRAVLAASLPVAAFALAPALVGATPVKASPAGSAMRERAEALLALFDPSQKEAALFAFDGRRRRAWNFMLGSRRAPGVPLEAMTEAQKVATMDLLASALGETGMVKAERIMLQQDIMRDEWGKGAPDRNRERFSIQFYGTPSPDGPWSWRFEGHHLSLTFTLVGDEVVSITPSSFSSEPNTVPSGPHKGMVVLEEESIGRRIFADLSPQQRARALIREGSYGNILTTAGRESRFGETREGIALADLPQTQVDEIVRLVEVFAVDNFAPALAAAEAARIREGDLAAAHFGWAGDDRAGSIYYRLHGDTFLIEFATLRNQPLHHHAVRHDLARNFGDHVL